MNIPENTPETHSSQRFLPELDIAKRLSVYIAAGAAALAFLAAEVPEAQATIEPADATASAKKKKCPKRQQIRLTLKKADANPDTEGPDFMLVARTCRTKKPNNLKRVKLYELGEQGQNKSWKFKRFPPGRNRERKFSLQPRDPENPYDAYDDGVYSVTLKAVNRKGKQLGRSRWNLRFGPEGHVSILREPRKYCRPRPDFEVGIQDDDQFVHQEVLTRAEAFDASSVLYGVKTSVLRINVIYGKVMSGGQPIPGGMQPYIDTVNEAAARGMKVHLTVMQTPSYYPKMDQGFGFEMLDPLKAESFGRFVASTLGAKVDQYTVVNEPNHPDFSATQSKLIYGNAFIAGRKGIQEADPSAKVLAGETAGGSPEWIEYLNTLPNDGIAIHPYNHVIDEINEIVDQSQTTLFLSEYGNRADDPNQAEMNQEAVRKARCAGAKELIYYQLERNPDKNWDTGIINLREP